jgi:hypothetical protein
LYGFIPERQHFEVIDLDHLPAISKVMIDRIGLFKISDLRCFRELGLRLRNRKQKEKLADKNDPHAVFLKSGGKHRK